MTQASGMPFTGAAHSACRMVGVLAPVRVDEFDEPVDADNLIARADHQTHDEVPDDGTDRKRFVAELSRADRLLDAPATGGPSVPPPARGFDAREAECLSPPTRVTASGSASTHHAVDHRHAHASASHAGNDRRVVHTATLRPLERGRSTSARHLEVLVLLAVATLAVGAAVVQLALSSGSCRAPTVAVGA